MTEVKLSGLPPKEVENIRKTQTDSNNQPLEVKISNGNGNPCRHCLKMIEKDEEFYVLAHRPFSTIQPYAEMGPIFLHKKECKPYVDDGSLPSAITNKETLIMRGYDKDERIVYGTGKIVPRQELRSQAKSILEMEDVEFVHVRSTTNNCYQARIDNS